MTHDPLCIAGRPASPGGKPASDWSFCGCELIAKVRADERKRIGRQIRKMQPVWSQTYDGKWLVGRAMAARIAEKQ